MVACLIVPEFLPAFILIVLSVLIYFQRQRRADVALATPNSCQKNIADDKAAKCVRGARPSSCKLPRDLLALPISWRRPEGSSGGVHSYTWQRVDWLLVASLDTQ